ncbi:MAG: helix-turn-helix transcriptional regulator [bacterium]|nr:helix-turn-helix transcriptional regulator [bacterium]
MALITRSRKESTTSVEPRPGCIKAALCILGDKWSPLLLSQLVGESQAFGQLEKALVGISPRTLSARLDMLQNAGVVEKKLYCEHPPRYNYRLTPKGNELVDILHAMSKWGDKHHDL